MIVNTQHVHVSGYYQRVMDTQAKRLKAARKAAGFKTVKAAAKFLHIPTSTYGAHENGQNGLKEESAAVYAKGFKVSKEWLLLGMEPNDPLEIGKDMVQLDDDWRKFVSDGLANLMKIAKQNSRKIPNKT